MTQFNLLPPAVVTFAVTGHRSNRMDQDAAAHVGSTLRKLFIEALGEVQKIRAAFADHFSGSAELRLVSMLASGADTIAANMALAEKMPLHAILPMPVDLYLKDFGDEEAAEFYELKSRCARVLELPDEPNAFGRGGFAMVEHADVLLAVWDGEPGRGHGGTAHIVQHAANCGRPIFVVSPGTSGHVSLLLPNKFHAQFEEIDVCRVKGEPAAGKMGDIIRDILQPPANGEGVRFQILSPPVKWRRPEYRILLKVVSGIKSASVSVPKTQDVVPQSQPYISGIRPYFEQMDARANEYGQLWRSSFVARYFVGVIIAVLAGLGAALTSYQALFFTISIAVNALIITDGWIAKKRKWRSRWLAFRYLAERMRGAGITSLFGALPALEAAPNTWLEWYWKRICRYIGFSSLRADPINLQVASRTMCVGTLSEQIAYHKRRAVNSIALDRKLSRMAIACFCIAALSGIVYWLARISQLFSDIPLTGVATVLFTAAPTLAAALTTVRIHGDFGRQASQSLEIAENLEKVVAVCGETGVSYDKLVRAARYASDVLSIETEDWRRSVEARGLPSYG